MDLSKDELQYLLNAVDTHIRANGLNAATVGSILAVKINTAAEALPDDDSGNK